LEKYGQNFRTLDKVRSDLDMAASKINPNSPEYQKTLIELETEAEKLRQLKMKDPNLETQKSQLELAKIRAQINNINTDTANIGKKATSTTNPYLTYKNYYDAGKQLKNATTKDLLGIEKPKNTDQDVIDWVFGLPLTEEEQARLLNDLGVKEPKPQQNTQQQSKSSTVEDWMGSLWED